MTAPTQVFGNGLMNQQNGILCSNCSTLIDIMDHVP